MPSEHGGLTFIRYWILLLNSFTVKVGLLYDGTNTSPKPLKFDCDLQKWVLRCISTQTELNGLYEQVTNSEMLSDMGR